MEIAHALHPDIYLSDQTTEALVRRGQVRSEVLTGEPQVRDFSLKSRYEFALELADFRANSDKLIMYETFLDQTRLGVEPFWLHVPISRKRAGLYCGPQGDGTEKTFPLPLRDFSNVIVMTDGVPEDTSAYTLHDVANCMDDDQASPEAGFMSNKMESLSVQSTITAAYGFSKWGIACFKGVPQATMGNHGITTPTSYRVPVEASTDYRIGGAVFCMASGSWQSLALFYDSGGTPIGSAVFGDATSCSSSAWTWVEDTMTSPANAVSVIVGLQRSTSTDADWYVDCMFVNPGQHERWWYPSCAPGLIEFASAPAALERITASGTGELVLPVRIMRPAAAWTLVISDATPTALEVAEVVER